MLQFLILAILSLLGGSHARKEVDLPHLTFTSCSSPGWQCVNSTDISMQSASYECQKIATGQRVRNPYYGNQYGEQQLVDEFTKSNFTLNLSDWEDQPITSLTIKGCGVLDLSMYTAKKTTLQTLIIEEIDNVRISGAKGEATFHPQNLVFRSIKFIPVLPENMISGKAKEIEFDDVTIGTIEKKAIFLKSPLDVFVWQNVKCFAMKERSITVEMEKNGRVHINKANFPRMRPFALQIKGGRTVIENSQFHVIQEGSIIASVDSFNFTKNIVEYDLGQIYVTTPDLTVKGNRFMNIPSSSLETPVRWAAHSNSDIPKEANLCYEDNVTGYRNNIPCTSRVIFTIKVNNCSTIVGGSDDLYGISENITVLNMFVCKNECVDTGSCSFPTAWEPAQLWAKYLCPAPASNASELAID